MLGSKINSRTISDSTDEMIKAHRFHPTATSSLLRGLVWDNSSASSLVMPFSSSNELGDVVCAPVLFTDGDALPVQVCYPV